MRHIETGYQRELTYRRNDYSFSAFGNADKAGSTWLTAFVVKSFIQARPYIDVDPKVIEEGIKFLFNRQKKDGSFPEYGEVHNKALQGGSTIKLNASLANETSSSALTSYVLIAILQEPKSSPIRTQNAQAIERALEYVNGRLLVSGNAYEIAIGAYALHLAESPNKDFAYRKLTQLMRKNKDGLQYWTLQANEEEAANRTSERIKKGTFFSDYLLLPNAVDVETTSYGLLTMVHRSDIDNSVPVLQWLISKQNSNGGFASTQDTVIGLQALGALAQRISTTTVKMSVALRSGNSEKGEKIDENAPAQRFHFSTENALVLQQIQMEPNTEWVQLEASGFGSAIVQVSYQYNLAVSAEKPAFFLNPQKDKTSTENYLQLSVCT